MTEKTLLIILVIWIVFILFKACYRPSTPIRELITIDPQGEKLVKICATDPRLKTISCVTSNNGCPMDFRTYLYRKTFVAGEYLIRHYEHLIIKDFGEVIRVCSVVVSQNDSPLIVIDIAGDLGNNDSELGLSVVKLDPSEIWYMDLITAHRYGVKVPPSSLMRNSAPL